MGNKKRDGVPYEFATTGAAALEEYNRLTKMCWWCAGTGQRVGCTGFVACTQCNGQGVVPRASQSTPN